MILTIVTPDGRQIEAPVTADAKRAQELMKEDSLTLQWSDATHHVIPVGSQVVYGGCTYVLHEPHYPQCTDGAEWKYSPRFEHRLWRLNKTPFMLYTMEQGEVKSAEPDWNFTGSRVELQSALNAAIEHGSDLGYTVSIDSALEAALTLQFSNQSIIAALNSACQQWEAEWWYDEQRIYVAKQCVHGEAVALADGEQVISSSTKTRNEFYNRYYVFGSDRNIPQDYNGAQATQIVNKRLTLSPSKHPQGYIDLPQFDADGNALTDANGNLIPDASVGLVTFAKTLLIEDVYPKSDLTIATITSVLRYMRDADDRVVYLDEAKTQPDTYRIYFLTLRTAAGDTFTINPSTYDSQRNPSGSLIKGKTLSIHFKEGMLTGREFELAYYDTPHTEQGDDGSKVTIPANAFEVVMSQDGTIIIPNGTIMPAVGEGVIVFNINLPQSYIEAAQDELESKALAAMWDDSRDKNAYSVKTNKVWFEANDPQLAIGSRIAYTTGGRTIETRVTKIERCVDRPSEATYTFCKEQSKGSITVLRTAIESTAKDVIEVSVKDDRAVAEARRKAFEAQRELRDMVFDTDGYFKDGNLRPETIETLLLQVGATSTQFTLQNVLFSPNVVTNGVTNVNRLDVASNSGKLVHTGIDPTQVRTWNVAAASITGLANQPYYIYARCAVSGTACQIVADTAQVRYNEKVESHGVYMFLVGTLSSVMAASGNANESRVLSLTYGATTVSGGQVRTGRISSVDGQTFFDLDSGTIGGNITFRGTADYNELSQGVSAATSTANSANSTANSAAAAAAAAQSDIDALAPNVITEVDVEYASGTSATTAPTSGWNTSAPAWEAGKYIWQRTRTTYGDGTSDTSAPTCIQGAKGADGTNGTNGRDGTNGTNGTNGTDGKGITSIKEQYYLSTSSTAQSGGSWQDTQPAWSSGKYLWTRSYIKWTAGADSTTTPVLADALNKANSTAATAQSTANTANSNASTAVSTANTANSTANAAKTKIDSLQVGGRNIVRNSQGNDVTDWVFSGTLMDDDHFGSCVSKTVTSGEGYLAPPRIYGFEPSAQYTLTAWIKPNDELRVLRLYLLSDRTDNKKTGSGYVDVAQAPSITSFTRNQWQLVQWTFTTRADIYSGYLRFTNGGPITAGAAAEIRLCRIKLERGNIATDWTPAPEDVQQQVSDLDYLKNTFSEGTTEVGGGVVLSSFLGVKEGDAVVAGMQADPNYPDLPMIFAGAPSAKQSNDAKFRVKKNGHVEMRDVNIISDSGGEAVAVEAGAIKIGSLIGGQVPQPTMIISSEQKNTVAEMIQQSSAGTDTGSVTSAARTLSKTNSHSQMVQTASETLTLWTKIVPQAVTGGTYQLTPCATFNATLTGDTGNKGESDISASVSYVVKINGAIAYTLGSGSYHRLLQANGTWEASDNFTISMAPQPILVQVKPGDTLTIERTLSVTSARFPAPTLAGDVMLLTVPTTATLTMPAKNPLVSYTNAVTVWNNRYYGNGLFLSSASNQYIGISSAAADNVLMQWRHGDGWLRYKKNAGLLWKQTNDANAPFFRVNPLVMVVRLKFVNNSYQAEAKYNPLNKSVSVATNGQGNVTLTHNLACANLTFTGSGCNGQRAYIDFLVVNSNKATIKIGNDASPDSFDVDVLIYDYGSY